MTQTVAPLANNQPRAHMLSFFPPRRGCCRGAASGFLCATFISVRRTTTAAKSHVNEALDESRCFLLYKIKSGRFCYREMNSLLRPTTQSLWRITSNRRRWCVVRVWDGAETGCWCVKAASSDTNSPTCSGSIHSSGGWDFNVLFTHRCEQAVYCESASSSSFYEVQDPI